MLDRPAVERVHRFAGLDPEERGGRERRGEVILVAAGVGVGTAGSGADRPERPDQRADDRPAPPLRRLDLKVDQLVVGGVRGGFRGPPETIPSIVVKVPVDGRGVLLRLL